MPDERVKITILGAGSWGATLAHIFAGAGKNVFLYTRDFKKAQSIKEKHGIEKPIAVSIPESVAVTSNLSEALEAAQIIIFCCNSQAVRNLAQAVAEHIPKDLSSKKDSPILVSTVKGLELTTLLRMSEVIQEIIPQLEVCALSGPNLAGEILKGLPAASVIASANLSCATTIQQALSIPKFRLYTNADILGVELGGSLKNVIAIAAGGCDGLNLGSNAKAALLTRGLAEMTRLAVTLGAKPLTLSGLSGMGDLIATCEGVASRNYRFGKEFVRGKKLETIMSEIGAAIEGVPTARAVCQFSERLKIELPIASQVDDALRGKTSAEGAIMSLMSRPLASEQL